MLKVMNYAAEGDKVFVQEKLFKLAGDDQDFLGFEEIKTVICGIEGVFAQELFADKTIQLKHLQDKTQKDLTSKVWTLYKFEDFHKFKCYLKPLMINKQHIEYALKQKRLEEIKCTSPKNEFKPQINRKSQ